MRDGAIENGLSVNELDELERQLHSHEPRADPRLRRTAHGDQGEQARSGHGEAQHAGDFERQHAKTRHYVQRMADEFSNRIVADAMVLASLRTGRT